MVSSPQLGNLLVRHLKQSFPRPSISIHFPPIRNDKWKENPVWLHNALLGLEWIVKQQIISHEYRSSAVRSLQISITALQFSASLSLWLIMIHRASAQVVRTVVSQLILTGTSKLNCSFTRREKTLHVWLKYKELLRLQVYLTFVCWASVQFCLIVCSVKMVGNSLLTSAVINRLLIDDFISPATLLADLILKRSLNLFI